MINRMNSTLALLKKTKPLVLCLTNYVTMDFMANSLLALGAAPIMSCANEEFSELIYLSHALYINIGTLDKAFIDKALIAAHLAKTMGKPVVLDPVGVGASPFRTENARKLMPYATIIRGNASEIMGLLDDEAKTRGVDSASSTEVAKNHAVTLAKQLNCTVVISGEQDCITDGHEILLLNVGSPLMPLITGMGCSLTAVIAAFCAITSPYIAASLATLYFGLCGNMAETVTDKPGSFRAAFIDALYIADIERMRDFYDK